MRQTDPPRDLAHLLAQVERQVTNRLRAILEPAGCTVDEWRVLTLLADGTGHTMTEIADYALLPAPTLTKLVDRLVANNWLYRRIDPADRRRVRAFLTPRGKDFWRRMGRAVQECQSDLLAATNDGHTLETLLIRLADTLVAR
jgi:DNA-binding MarR family transcriptional regulator